MTPALTARSWSIVERSRSSIATPGREARNRSTDDRQQRRADEPDPQPPGLPGVDPPRGGDRALEFAEHHAGVP